MSLLLLLTGAEALPTGPTIFTASNNTVPLPVSCVLAGENQDKFKESAADYSARQLKSIFGEK